VFQDKREMQYFFSKVEDNILRLICEQPAFVKITISGAIMKFARNDMTGL
jgi:hypothetical protein